MAAIVLTDGDGRVIGPVTDLNPFPVAVQEAGSVVYKSVGEEQLTVSSASVALASIPDTASRAIMRVRGANIFMAQSGNPASTTTGMRVDDGSFIDVTDGEYELGQFRFIRAGTVDATLDVLYYE